MVAAGVEFSPDDPGLVAPQEGDRTAALGVPKARRPVVRNRDQAVAVGGVGNGADAVPVSLENGHRDGRIEPPDTRGPIQGSGHHSIAGGGKNSVRDPVPMAAKNG